MFDTKDEIREINDLGSEINDCGKASMMAGSSFSPSVENQTGKVNEALSEATSSAATSGSAPSGMAKAATGAGAAGAGATVATGAAIGAAIIGTIETAIGVAAISFAPRLLSPDAFYFYVDEENLSISYSTEIEYNVAGTLYLGLFDGTDLIGEIQEYELVEDDEHLKNPIIIESDGDYSSYMDEEYPYMFDLYGILNEDGSMELEIDKEYSFRVFYEIGDETEYVIDETIYTGDGFRWHLQEEPVILVDHIGKTMMVNFGLDYNKGKTIYVDLREGDTVVDTREIVLEEGEPDLNADYPYYYFCEECLFPLFDETGNPSYDLEIDTLYSVVIYHYGVNGQSIIYGDYALQLKTPYFVDDFAWESPMDSLSVSCSYSIRFIDYSQVRTYLVSPNGDETLMGQTTLDYDSNSADSEGYCSTNISLSYTAEKDFKDYSIKVVDWYNNTVYETPFEISTSTSVYVDLGDTLNFSTMPNQLACNVSFDVEFSYPETPSENAAMNIVVLYNAESVAGSDIALAIEDAEPVEGKENTYHIPFDTGLYGLDSGTQYTLAITLLKPGAEQDITIYSEPFILTPDGDITAYCKLVEYEHIPSSDGPTTTLYYDFCLNGLDTGSNSFYIKAYQPDGETLIVDDLIPIKEDMSLNLSYPIFSSTSVSGDSAIVKIVCITNEIEPGTVIAEDTIYF